MKKLAITFILFFMLSLTVDLVAQKRIVSLEFGANLGYSANMGDAGLKIYNKTSYPLSGRIGVSGCLGYFQSLFRFENISSRSNFSSLLLDADVDLCLWKSPKGNSVTISSGLTYFRGESSFASVGYIYAENVMTVAKWEVDPINNIGFNAKIRYDMPLSKHLYSAINADIYCIEAFTLDDLVSLGYSIGYRF